MEVQYKRNFNVVKFGDLEIGDTFMLDSKTVFVKTRFFSMCSREGISPFKCVPIDYNSYNLTLNYFGYLTDDEEVTKVNCILEIS